MCKPYVAGAACWLALPLGVGGQRPPKYPSRQPQTLTRQSLAAESLWIVGIDPDTAVPGAKVTLKLSRPLSAPPESITVRFGGSQALVQLAASNVLYVTLPSDLTSGDQPPVVVIERRLASSPYTGFVVRSPFAALVNSRWYFFLIGNLGVLAFVAIAYYYLRLRARRRREAGATLATSRPQASGAEPSADKVDRRVVRTRASAAATPAPEAPEALVDAVRRGECILYAGGGLAAQAGLPTWVPFLSRLTEHALQGNRVPDEYGASLIRALEAGSYQAVADDLAERIPRDDLGAEIRETLKGAKPSAAHEILARLPFAAALTTNFDTLLRDAFTSRSPRVLVPGDAPDLLEALRGRHFFVLHLYGSVDRPGSVVLTVNQYRQLVAQNLAFRQFVQTLFERYTLFFVGASIAGLRDYLDGLELAQVASGLAHFALVADPQDVDEVQIRVLQRRYGITILHFRPRPEYPEVAEFLRTLERRVASAPSPATQSTPSFLTRVSLRSIGPFPSLDLDLTPGWNVLLGDNGLGKSFILRAIAAALCGPAADEKSVTRLLRTGSTSGRIELIVGADRYAVDLERDAHGKIVMRAGTISPIVLSNWLVIGFPPLRGVTWERPTGPTDTSDPKPRPEDLLPILGSAPDDRMRGLKQWLINLDYRRSRGGLDAERAGAVFDRFFAAMGQLTVNLELRFSRIDHDTMAIMVHTASGEAPLEAISQGTISVLCWVGVLLQRLYDVHGATSDPLGGPALVLVDEIDAHMHPSWQQSLAPAVKKLLPNAQVIATTHSPLIVAAMGAQELVTLQRSPDGAIIVDRPQVTTHGLRADQILTSPLFNLESTRDPETHAMLMRYTELIARREILPEEERGELDRLAAQLKIRMPSPEERADAREASDMVEKALDREIAAMPPNKRERLLKEMRAQIQETVSDSRRPS